MEFLLLHLLFHELPVLILTVVAFFTGRKFCPHTFRFKSRRGDWKRFFSEPGVEDSTHDHPWPYIVKAECGEEKEDDHKAHR